LEKAQFCLLFITKDWSLLKNFIQGQQRPKSPMKAKKAIKGQNFKKSMISSIFNVKSSINGNVNKEKVVFQKLKIFIFIT
jgi:hypothetical protein